MQSNTSNISWSENIANLLVKKRIKHACISPGSRNTPLTHALIKEKSIKCISHIDERSNGFFSLGIAKKTKSPALVLTTSGTATANLLPAIIEAYYSMTPLIIITADRPKNLTNSGENQTINQVDIYKNFIRKMIDINITNQASTLKKIDDIINISNGNHKNIPGPVHINIRFEEPLFDKKQKKVKLIPKKNIIINKKTNLKLPIFKKPLIVCGHLDSTETKYVYKLIKQLNFPVFADINSDLRHYKNKNIKVFYDFYCHKITNPDLIIRFGSKPISKKLNKLLSINRTKTYLINPYLYFNDDSKYIIRTFPKNILINKNHIIDKKWIDRIEDFENGIISNYSTISRKKDTEFSILKSLLNNLKEKDHLFIGNSSPVRSFNKYSGKLKNQIHTFTNRGASGIDGIISTSLGISSINKKSKNFLVIGDISFFHDINGFNVLQSTKIDLTIIAINNNGGKIFASLDYADKKIDRFNEFWVTPQNIEIKNITKVFNIKYFKLNAKSLNDRLSKISSFKGVKVIEIKTSHLSDFEVDKKLSLI